MGRPTRASRALSQNFLTDRGAAARLAGLAAPRPTPLLIEVGAGKGALTDLLAPRCRRLLAYEIDSRLVPALRERFSDTPQVQVVEGDFLLARPPRTPFAVMRQRALLTDRGHRRLVPAGPRTHRRDTPHPARVRP